MDWLAPLGIDAAAADPASAAAETDLLDAAHMVIAVDVSWLALRAWTQARQRGEGQSGPGRLRLRPWSMASPAPAADRALCALQPWSPVTSHGARSIAPNGASRRAVGAWSSPVRADRREASLGGRRRNVLRRRPAVQIAAYEEHRCPYCLQDIKRDDVRGSVECPICHTLHHKDCWDITGTCQVPHLNG